MVHIVMGHDQGGQRVEREALPVGRFFEQRREIRIPAVDEYRIVPALKQDRGDGPLLPIIFKLDLERM
ncbi:hypothetical protein J6TS7_45700 [Paenibacillus dendritiformis]|nr:hypothetical protein J6TS7_45700 [Paenibacillus dendritiformis]